MAAEHTALIAVRVGFAGKPGPHRAGHRAKGFKFHTKTGQLWRTGYAVVNGIHPQCALCFHSVDQLCAGPRHSGDAKLELHLYAVGTCFQHLHAVICYKHIRRHPGRRARGKPHPRSLSVEARQNAGRGARHSHSVPFTFSDAGPAPRNGEKASQSFLPFTPRLPSPWVTTRGRRGGSARLRPAYGLPVLPQQRWRHPAPHGPPGWRTSSVHPAWRASLRHRRIQCRCR